MSNGVRTVEEYTKLYAEKHNISIDEAREIVMVKMFGEYAKNNGNQK